MIWYRVGRKLKRTIYRCSSVNPDGYYVAITDDPEFAEEICHALNYWEKQDKEKAPSHGGS